MAVDPLADERPSAHIEMASSGTPGETSREAQAEEIGDFAVKAWADWEAGTLTARQTKNAAKILIGKLHSFAIGEGIEPPEKVIFELNEDAESASLNLLETGIDIDRSDAKPLHPNTVRRIKKLLSYADSYEGAPSIEAGDSGISARPVTAASDSTRHDLSETYSPETLREVTAHQSSVDSTAEHVQAVRYARSEMEERA